MWWSSFQRLWNQLKELVRFYLFQRKIFDLVHYDEPEPWIDLYPVFQPSKIIVTLQCLNKIHDRCPLQRNIWHDCTHSKCHRVVFLPQKRRSKKTTVFVLYMNRIDMISSMRDLSMGGCGGIIIQNQPWSSGMKIWARRAYSMSSLKAFALTLLTGDNAAFPCPVCHVMFQGMDQWFFS